MRLRDMINFSGAVALFSAWLVACEGTVVQVDTDESTPNAPRSNSCAQTCEQQHPKGLEIYNIAMGSCVCATCNDTCMQSVCSDQKTPTSTCLPCAQESLAGDGCANDGLFGTCRHSPSCMSFVDCLLACSP